MHAQKERSAVPQPVSDVLASPGRPLDAPSRAFFEPRFGHDFSRVRVHADERAAQSSAAIGARAWTVGNDIAFAHGAYAPPILGHELAHVVQQSGASPTAAPELGQPGDAYERDAENAQPQLRASAPRLQGFWGALAGIAAGIGALVYGLYRMLSDSFSKEELQRYLKWIRNAKRIQDDFDSDNKARACVSREKELGPYSVDDRVLLINEMVSGFTLGADEAAILATLQAAPPADVPQIVTRVGRGRLWSNFSGRNRRLIEAATLTAADAGAALVTRLRDLDPEAIQDYVRHATDPAVRASATQAASLSTVTAPVPVDARFNAVGQAIFAINGIDVVALPDEESNRLEKGEALTTMDLVVANLQAVSPTVPPQIRAEVQTHYGTGTDKRKKASYGRGTTDADKRAARTSLRFHEGRHGEDWFEFLHDTAPPVFTGHPGMNGDEFGRAMQAFGDALNDYNCRALAFSVQKSDCVGKIAPDKHTRAAHRRCPSHVAICSQGGTP
jgi:Domain of unknown function (DUF4157)